MKILLASLLLAAASAPAVAGPDFHTPNPRPSPLAPSESARELGPLDDVIFAYDSHALDSTGLQQLETAAAWLKRHPRYRLVLEGYADRSGHALYNQDLAERRAMLVREHLVALGVPRDRLLVVVYGEERAHAGVHPLDRRVVLYASTRPARELATISLDRGRALTAVWTERGQRFTATRDGVLREVVSRR